MFFTAWAKYENKTLTRQRRVSMTRIARILHASRTTLVADAVGIVAISTMTLGLLHLPALF